MFAPKSFLRFLTIFGIFLLIALPIAVSAQGIVPCSGLDCRLSHVFDLLVGIYNLLLGLAGIVAILFIIFAGVRMALYHWFENPEQELTAAKSTLTRAVFGLIIVIVAYVLVFTLLTLLGVDNPTRFFTGSEFR